MYVKQCTKTILSQKIRNLIELFVPSLLGKVNLCT